MDVSQYLEYWEKTKNNAHLMNLIENPYRFLLKIAGDPRLYPCWIGKKHIRGNAALLIAKKDDPEPQCQNARSRIIRIDVPGTAFCLYRFLNQGDLETYVEFQNYMWAQREAACLYYVNQNNEINESIEGVIPSGQITDFLDRH